jgi:hypothetical protein
MLARVMEADDGWRTCRVSLYEGDVRVHEDADARCRIAGGEILVAYMDDEGPVVLAGHARTPGCFDLHARSRPRRADLALAGDGCHLAGAWRERDRSGRWEIALDAPQAARSPERAE